MSTILYGIDLLNRDQLIDLLDNTLGVGCYDEAGTESIRAEAWEAYNAGAISDDDVAEVR